jgi:hypothetical protein
MLFYRAALPLSSRTLTFVAGIIRRHRASIGSPWRTLNPGQQALLVLVYLRKGETFAEVAAAFGVGTSTAWRYVNETVALLAARAPKLRNAVRDARKAGHAYVVLDGINRSSPHTPEWTPGDVAAGLAEELVEGVLIGGDGPPFHHLAVAQMHNVHGVDVHVLAAPAGCDDHEPDTVLVVREGRMKVNLERSLRDLHDFAEESEDGLPPAVVTG